VAQTIAALDVALRAQTREFRRGMRRATGQLQQFRDSFRRVKGQLVGLFAGITAGAGLTAAVREIGNFELAMAQLRGVTGATGRSLVALRENARRLGATTQFSATQAAEGQLALARAGFATAETISASLPALDLAISAQTDLGRSAEITANLVRQFQLEAAESGRVVDVLVSSSNRANTNILEMAEAFSKAGTISGALGKGVEETAAAIGVISDRGEKASEAGTRLRGILQTLAQATKDANLASKFEAVGVSMDELDPKTNSIADIFERLGQAGLDVASATELFDKRNAAAAVTLSQSADRLREVEDANRRAAGASRDFAAGLENTLIGKFRSFKSVLAELALQTGDAGLAGAMKRLLSRVTDALRVIAGMEDAVEGNVGAARRLAVGFKFIAARIAVALALKPVLFFGRMAKAIVAATVAMKGLNLAFLKNPFTLVASLIATVVGGLFALSDEQVAVGKETFQLRDVLVGAWREIRDRVSEAWTQLMAFLGKQLEKLRGFVRGVLEKIRKFFVEVGERFGIDWGEAFETVKRIAKKFANFMIAIFVGIGRGLGAVIQQFVDVGRAIGRLDFSGPRAFFRSLGRVGGELKDALDPVGQGKRFVREFVAAFETDYVKGSGDAAAEGAKIVSKELSKAADTVTFEFGRFVDAALGRARGVRSERQRREVPDIEAPDIKLPKRIQLPGVDTPDVDPGGDVDKEVDKVRLATKRVSDEVRTAQDAFSQLFETAIFDAGRLEDALADLGRQLAGLVAKQFLEPIAQGVGQAVGGALGIDLKVENQLSAPAVVQTGLGDGQVFRSVAAASGARLTLADAARDGVA